MYKKNCKLITNIGYEKLNKEKCPKKRLSNLVWYLKRNKLFTIRYAAKIKKKKKNHV